MDPICHVQPEHVSMLKFFGSVALVSGIVSYIKGVTYFRGLIYKSEDPTGYWTATISLCVLGGFVLLGVQVCQ